MKSANNLNPFNVPHAYYRLSDPPPLTVIYRSNIVDGSIVPHCFADREEVEEVLEGLCEEATTSPSQVSAYSELWDEVVYETFEIYPYLS